MIELKYFINSLKCTWIKRIFDSDNKGQWKQVYTQKLARYGGKLLFECELNKDIINTLFKDNTFLKQILISWTEVRKSETIPISKQVIWNNKNVHIGNKTIFFKDWSSKGINYIEDLFDYRTKQFHTFQYLADLFDLSNKEIIHYNQIISCLSAKWKHDIKTSQMNIPGQIRLIHTAEN